MEARAAAVRDDAQALRAQSAHQIRHTRRNLAAAGGLLEVHMPGLNGVETAPLIRDQRLDELWLEHGPSRRD